MMRDVLLEVDGGDVFASIAEGLNWAEKLEIPAIQEISNEKAYPHPPTPEKSMPDAMEVVPDLDLSKLSLESQKAKLEALEVFPVIVKSLEGCEGQCVVCLQPLMRICLKCDSRDTDYHECELLQGVCGHTIHGHCYLDYRKEYRATDSCLVCRQDWKVTSTFNLSTETFEDPKQHSSIPASI